MVPELEKSIALVHPDDPHIYELLVFDEPTRSWATVNVTPEALEVGQYPVRQHGPRRLWDEIETAHRWWVEHDRPTYSEYGITVGPDRQVVWFHHPDQPLPITAQIHHP